MGCSDQHMFEGPPGLDPDLVPGLMMRTAEGHVVDPGLVTDDHGPGTDVDPGLGKEGVLYHHVEIPAGQDPKTKNSALDLVIEEDPDQNRRTRTKDLDHIPEIESLAKSQRRTKDPDLDLKVRKSQGKKLADHHPN